MSKMNKPKRRHHYIPQFYLKGFTDADPSDPYDKLYVYSKDRIESYGDVMYLAPKDIGYEKDGYTLRLSDGTTDSEIIENKFAEMDNIAALLLKKILNGQRLNEEESNCFTWNFLTTMSMRTPVAREQCKTIANILKINLKWQENMDPLFGFLQDYDFKLFRAAKWICFKAPVGSYFLTSDNPFLSTKWDNKATILILPLSKNYCIVGSTNHDFIINNFTKKANQEIRKINSIIIKSASRDIYCHFKAQSIYGLVRKYKDSRPEIDGLRVKELLIKILIDTLVAYLKIK